MKSKTLLLLSFFPIFFLQACGGGKIVMKSTNGSDISIKKENVFCKRTYYETDRWQGGDDYAKAGEMQSIICTANGVQTDLTNRQYPFSEEKRCWWRAYKPNEMRNEDSFACSAADKFGLLEEYLTNN